MLDKVLGINVDAVAHLIKGEAHLFHKVEIFAGYGDFVTGFYGIGSNAGNLDGLEECKLGESGNLASGIVEHYKTGLGILRHHNPDLPGRNHLYVGDFPGSGKGYAVDAVETRTDETEFTATEYGRRPESIQVYTALELVGVYISTVVARCEGDRGHHHQAHHQDGSEFVAVFFHFNFSI